MSLQQALMASNAGRKHKAIRNAGFNGYFVEGGWMQPYVNYQAWDGATIFWELSYPYTGYAPANSADFTGTTSGSFTPTGDGWWYAPDYISIVADNTTEGYEYVGIKLGTYPGGNDIYDSQNNNNWQSLYDSSTTPAYAATFANGNFAWSVNEGTTTTYNLNTNAPDGGRLYWNIVHGTTTAADFVEVQGSIGAYQGASSFDVTTIADHFTEGNRTFRLEVRRDSNSGDVLVQTGSDITLVDSSQSPTALDFYLAGVPSPALPESIWTSYDGSGTKAILHGTWYRDNAYPSVGGAQFDLGRQNFLEVGQNINATAFTIIMTAEFVFPGSGWYGLFSTGSYANGEGVQCYWTNNTLQIGTPATGFDLYTAPVSLMQNRAQWAFVVDGPNGTTRVYKDGVALTRILNGFTSLSSLGPTNWVVGARFNNRTSFTDFTTMTLYDLQLRMEAVSPTFVANEWNTTRRGNYGLTDIVVSEGPAYGIGNGIAIWTNTQLSNRYADIQNGWMARITSGPHAGWSATIIGKGTIAGGDLTIDPNGASGNWIFSTGDVYTFSPI
jgi:hypothetical protein